MSCRDVVYRQALPGDGLQVDCPLGIVGDIGRIEVDGTIGYRVAALQGSALAVGVVGVDRSVMSAVYLTGFQAPYVVDKFGMVDKGIAIALNSLDAVVALQLKRRNRVVVVPLEIKRYGMVAHCGIFVAQQHHIAPSLPYRRRIHADHIH